MTRSDSRRSATSEDHLATVEESALERRKSTDAGLTRYFVRRVAQFGLVVLGATVVVFLGINVAVDPIKIMLPLSTPPEVAEAFRHELGLDRPVIEQLASYLSNVIRLDFGDSLWLGGSAIDHVLSRLPATALIVLSATVIGVTLGWGLGMAAARWPDSIIDKVATSLGYLAISLPEFWVSLMLIWVFAVQFGWLPSSGYGVGWTQAILPVVALSLRPLGRTAQITRTSMAVEERRPYVLTAAAKGVFGPRLAIRHKLRNAALPIITIVFYDLGRLFIGTSVVVETVFSWPGVGSLAAGALARGDIFVVQAAVFVAAFITAGLNLTADMLYCWLDPKTRDIAR